MKPLKWLFVNLLKGFSSWLANRGQSAQELAAWLYFDVATPLEIHLEEREVA